MVMVPSDAPHTVGSVEVSVNVGTGFTVIVKVCAVPVHVPSDGVTVIVAVTGAEPAFSAVNEAMFADPLADKPMEGVSLVQLKFVPGIVPMKFTAAVAVFAHTVWSAGSETV